MSEWLTDCKYSTLAIFRCRWDNSDMFNVCSENIRSNLTEATNISAITDMTADILLTIPGRLAYFGSAILEFR